MKYKIFCVLMAIVILSTSLLSGCSKPVEENTTTEPVQETQSTTETTATTTETTTETTATTTETTTKPKKETTTKKQETTTKKPVKPAPIEDPPFVSSSGAKTAAEKFYKDAVFVGDSISAGLRIRATSKKKFPGAKYLVRTSFGTGHAIKRTMLLTYQGQELPAEDAIKACGAKKVFLLLGMNDLDIYGPSGTVKNMATLVERIRSKVPDVKIYIQSLTPMVTGSEMRKLTNPAIDEYNVLLKNYAANNDCKYVDVATNLKDSTNGLRPSYSSDNYVHLSSSGLDVWIATLEAYAETQMNTPKPEVTTQPEKPEETTQPEETTKPEETTQPEKPEETTQLEKPEETTQPEKPEDATQPQKVDEATEPQKPEETQPN